jgi:FKBP-type peptidyl-prolyl cis-trans isomerase FkpA
MVVQHNLFNGRLIGSSLIFAKISKKAMKKNLLCILLMTVIFSGCFKDPQRPDCNFDACAIVAPAAEIQQVQAYLTNNNITAVQHCSGLFYDIELAGTGKAATPCSMVAVKYEGKLTNGDVFDSQTTDAVAFNLGSLITGWKVGLPLIKEGGKIKLYVPPSLGYGSQANPPIPANSVLIFDIELVAVQ